MGLQLCRYSYQHLFTPSPPNCCSIYLQSLNSVWCHVAGYLPLAPLVIPSVVSGAQKTVKDLEQMATTDAEAIMDAIEELVQDTTHGSAAAADYRLADPVLSKSGQPLIQGELLIHTSHGLVCQPKVVGRCWQSSWCHVWEAGCKACSQCVLA